jgi:2-oxoglutarate dehydrogenase E2 component (dihydrolipoamide succinyltransferase)
MPLDIKIPTVGESVTEVTLSKWLVSDGDYVEMDQNLCEIESDKATFELPAEKAGQVKLIAKEGQDLKIGDVVCTIDTEVSAPAGRSAKPQADVRRDEPRTESKPETKPKESASYASGHASPAAAKLIRESTSPSKVRGTGRGGRITKQDVLTALSQGNGAGGARGERREPLSRLRRTIAAHLVAAKNQTAMLTTFNEVNMEPVLAIRSEWKEEFEKKHGVKLGFMSFFIKAVCNALAEFPAVNAMIEENDLIFHDYCDISIAVSTPRGLVVPVIRNAESLSFPALEKAVDDLATRGRDNKLALEEMEGGTFTVSNGGVFGSLMSTPILNAPQSAILGMHKIEARPVVDGDKIVIRNMMYLALSYDHRVIDGRESVSFLVKVKENLENPVQLLGKDVKKALTEEK